MSYPSLLLALGLVLALPALATGVFLDNNTLYSDQDPNNETRRSDHFRINFGHYNRDTGTPLTEELVQGNLQMFEQAWRRWVVEMGMNDLNESATNPDGNKYRANFNVLMSWNDGGGGGAYMSMDGNGFAYAMANTGYMRFDPPSGATPHEFGHVWQGRSAGFNGSDSSGSWWEGHANWMQLQFLNTYPGARGYIENGMYYPSHGRHYYDSFMIWEAALEDPRYGAAWVNDIWTNATPQQRTSEYMLNRMVRLDASGLPDKDMGMRDLWGDMARRLVTWDFKRQRWLATANEPDDGSNWSFYQRARTPLVAMPGHPGRFRPARQHTPMQYGFNIIPLDATPGSTVTCDFQPVWDALRSSDWRACLVAVDQNGGASYSTLWNTGTNTIRLSQDQTKLYLVVIGTPRPMKLPEPIWRAYLTDAGAQFPYSVAFTNSQPKNIIYPAQSRSTMTQHPNGGGWKSNSATVDATAYIGPNAQVLNSAQVRGNARIEDFAVVRNSAQVRNNAVVSGRAVVEGNAQVYNHAKVRDWARVFGHARVYENARVIEHANCGDGSSSSFTRIYGNAIIKGTTYVYAGSDFSGSLIMDGDSANGGTADKGVHFGWGWGNDVARFGALPDNAYLFSRLAFEKDSASFAHDQFGINHGILVNGARVATDSGGSSRTGRVLALDGASQYVELHNATNDFRETTIALWFKRSGTAPDQTLWSLGDGGSRVMRLVANDAATGALTFTIGNGATSHTLTGPVIPVNTWKHVAVTFAGGTCSLHVDGALSASTATSLFPDGLNAPLMENANFLGRGNAGNFFAGRIDEFHTYTRALTDFQIAALVATPAPATVAFPADSAAPVPNAPTWLVTPSALSDTTVAMSATPGTDASNWIEYSFTASGGGNDSGWISSHIYIDANVTPGTAPSYTIRMRDRAGNQTAASAPASASLPGQSLGTASFLQAPVGIANGQITMTAARPPAAVGKLEYKFDRTSPSAATSGWRASPTWTHTGLSTGSTHSYTVTIRDAYGNTATTSAASAAIARDDAPPQLPISEAHWQMMPYATIDNRISMTAQTATDASGVQYRFECLSGGGPNSNWQDNPKFVTAPLPVGSYVYRYQVRDKSARNNLGAHSLAYDAKITLTTGYRPYSLGEVLAGEDGWLVSFPATVMRVAAGYYIVKDLASGASIRVRPDTIGLTTNPSLSLRNVTVKGHLYTFGTERVVTYASLANTGSPALFTISGRVTAPDGAGVAGATVWFSDTSNPQADPIVSATTDSNGFYTRGLPNGTWFAAAGSPFHNTSGAFTLEINGANLPNIHFSLSDNAAVSGTITRRSDGSPVAGAQVFFSRDPSASAAPVFTATTNAAGQYSRALQDGIWYIAAAGSGLLTSPDKSIHVTTAPLAAIDFSLKSSARNIPRTSDLLFSALTENLPASGPVTGWPSFNPSGQTFTPIGSPAVENINGAIWLDNRYGDGDGFRVSGGHSSPVAIDGATIVTVARPRRNSTGTSWTSIVDLFYNRLVLGVRNNTGRIDVHRNGSHFQGTAANAIPDGQITILSLVVQPNGAFRVFANGSQVMNVTTTSSMTQLTPGVAGPYASAFNIGRNDPDGWTTFNGSIGDVFVYRAALTDAERGQIEADLTAKFRNTDPVVTATAGSGGTINPFGGVAVAPGGSQTFTIIPAEGKVIDRVSINGVNQGALASYTFTGVTSNQTIAATFKDGSNLPPTITDIADQSIDSDSSTGPLAFTIGDPDTPLANLTVTASSSNPVLVPESAITLAGSSANRTVTITPAAGLTGSAAITLTVSDGLLTASSSFLLEVVVPPGTPTISPIADLTIEQGETSGPLGFTVADPDGDAALLTVAATSSDTTLLPLSGIAFSGTGADRTVSLTPDPARNGAATVTLTVSDGTYSSATSFTLVVTPPNSPPSISPIPDQSVVRNHTTPPIPFTVSDLETPATALVVTATSSNHALVPPGNIALAGSGSSRSATITPITDRNGSAVVTLTVSDGKATASSSFTLSVTAPATGEVVGLNVGFNGVLAAGDVAGAVPRANWNNVIGQNNPVFAAGSMVNHEGTGVPGLGASFTGFANTFNAGSGPDTSMLSGFLNGGTMNVALTNVPYPVYDVYVYYNGFLQNYPLTWRLLNHANAAVLATQYSVRGSLSSGNVFGANSNTHVQSQYDTEAAATAAATAGNGGTYLKFSGISLPSIRIEEISNNGSNENGFTGIQIVSTAAAALPAISSIADLETPWNATSAEVPFTVSNPAGPASALTITVSSSNPALVPAESVVISGTGSNRSLTLTPASGQSGSALITLAVSNGTATVHEAFLATVLVVDQAPTISPIADVEVAAGTSSPAIPFTVGDDLTPAADLTVTAESSHPGLLPTSAIVIAGSDAERSVTLTPAAGFHGEATVTLTVSDGALSASTSFLATVNPPPPPTDPFTLWAQSKFGEDWENPAIAGPAADPDNDGSINLAEFAFGSEPLDPGSRPVLHVATAGSGEGPPSFMLVVPARRGADFAQTDGRLSSDPIDGILYTIEATASLGSAWDAAVQHLGRSDTPPAGSGLPDLGGTDWEYHRFSAFDGLPAAGFLRAAVRAADP
jgi:carbonic anhydrase/acetyltransferase-like protein (isoleucine patch superfamily)